MSDDQKYMKLLLSPSGSLPGGTNVDWTALVQASGAFSDNNEFIWVVLEKVTPIVIEAGDQQVGPIEISCQTMPQYSSYDNRNGGCAVSLGFAEYNNAYSITQGTTTTQYVEYAFESPQMGRVKMSYDMLRGKPWVIHLGWLNGQPLSSSQIQCPYMLQVGVYV